MLWTDGWLRASADLVCTWAFPLRAAVSRPPLLLAGLCPAGLRVDFPTFAELYADIFTEVPAMIAQQQLLLQAGVPCFLMSNCSGEEWGPPGDAEESWGEADKPPSGVRTTADPAAPLLPCLAQPCLQSARSDQCVGVRP